MTLHDNNHSLTICCYWEFCNANNYIFIVNNNNNNNKWLLLDAEHISNPGVNFEVTSSDSFRDIKKNHFVTAEDIEDSTKRKRI